MICPKCKELGLKSTIQMSQGGISTLMAADYHYDEEGKQHCHDPNSHTSVCYCSNGHTITRVTYRECWCGYNKGRDEIKVE